MASAAAAVAFPALARARAGAGAGAFPIGQIDSPAHGHHHHNAVHLRHLLTWEANPCKYQETSRPGASALLVKQQKQETKTK
jgi:hypothetical protein